MSNANMLLLSSSMIYGHSYLEHVRDTVVEFLPAGSRVAFVPWALEDYDRYTDTTATAMQALGISVTGIHTVASPQELLDGVDAIFVGGGNSFRLLKALYEHDLIDEVRARVTSGKLAYMGSSAGTNMSCPSLRTTNDMPIVQPPSFDAFNLIPFQINPHYQDPDPTSTHMGETREQRIAQFLEENDVAVVGLREGAWLRRIGDSLTLGGSVGARLFQRDSEAVEYTEGADLSFLLKLEPRFDSRAGGQPL
ncbi:MAG: dipeptidase PepE [Thermomicrobiales bacterium]|nr:dipeptidase PepE [Thermomicrobiales bacterium]